VSDPERFREIRESVEELFAPDAEHVTRHGTFRGPQKFISDWEVQFQQFEVTWDIELFDAGDSVAVVARILRRSRDKPDGYVDAPATGGIYRVRAGKITFFEGYYDARDAFEAAGLNPGLAHR
jgi:hypothetical protein